METENFAPYGAPENVMRILDRVRKNGMPSNRKIGPDYLRQLGIGEGMINRTLRSVEFLGFIGSDGSATDLMEQFIVASDEEWPALLESALRSSYESIFRVVDPANATRTQVLTAFRPMKPNGQWDRMVTLFLGLCKAAGMEVKDAPSQRPGKEGARPPAPRRPANPAPKPNAAKPATIPPPPVIRHNGVMHPALAGIVAAIPELETADDLERWIASFRATFQLIKKI